MIFAGRWLSVAVTVALLALAASIAANIYLAHAALTVKRTYFATDPTGRITALLPLSQPLENEGTVAQYVAGCITRTFSYDYVNYRQQFQRASTCYTQPALNDLEQQLVDNGVIRMVKKDHLVSSVALQAAPVLVHQGVHANHSAHDSSVYEWTFKVPGLITYQNADKSASTHRLFQITVARQSRTDKPNGIAIIRVQLRRPRSAQ